MTKTKDEGISNENVPTSLDPEENAPPQPNKPLGWKQGMGLYKRQKAVEALTIDVGNTLIMFFHTLTVDPNPETWFRRLNERREDFERLRKRLAIQ